VVTFSKLMSSMILILVEQNRTNEPKMATVCFHKCRGIKFQEVKYESICTWFQGNR
jgi:hypothetical protein